LVCIGDCGITPLDGGIPIRPHIITCHSDNISMCHNTTKDHTRFTSRSGGHTQYQSQIAKGKKEHWEKVKELSNFI